MPAAPDIFIHESAYVDAPVQIGPGTKIWHFCHILAGASIGARCIFGQNCSVAGGVTIGNNVKVQNNVSVYTGTVIEDDVFLGPSCVLTNVTNPRSQVNRHSLYERTLIRRGATVGANATIVCGVTIGRYAFIAAGAVVAKDVPDYALVAGVPGRQVGWMSRHGHRLHPGPAGIATCPESGFRYQLISAVSGQPIPSSALRSPPSDLRPPLSALRCLDLDEDAPLPPELAVGSRTYDDLKTGD